MAKDVWKDRNPAATAALLKQLRDQDRLGEVIALMPPQARKAIHAADQLNR